MPASRALETGSKGEKLAQRLSRILARLHAGESLDKHQMAGEFQVDVRTIERDLGERLHGLVERGATGRWQLVQSARSTIPAKHLFSYARMTGTEQLFPDMSLGYLLPQLDKPESMRATQVQSIAHEDLGGTDAFSALQQAVELRHSCHFIYKNKLRYAQPYRLIHSNGVWYLAAEEGGKLKNFSVALLHGLQVDTASSFTRNPAHSEYINAKDGVWFTAQTTEVLLRVAPAMAHYFTRRPLLPRQQQRTDADGSLLVTTHINHLNQLLPVVRYWLPHVRIVQPARWHDALVEELVQALAQWAPERITAQASL